MGTKWDNDDGLVIEFPPRTAEDHRNRPAEVGGLGGTTKQYVVEFSYDDLPVADTSDTGLFTLQEDVIVVEAKLVVTEAFVEAATGNDLLIGTSNDADGFIDAGDGDEANLTLGAVIIGTGALVGTRIAAADATQVVASFSAGTWSAGKAKLYLTTQRGEDVA